jgi:hypothetical protein
MGVSWHVYSDKGWFHEKLKDEVDREMNYLKSDTLFLK